MITESDEYKKLVKNRLRENMKSFQLLYVIEHYGNCISIMCQELEQLIRILFLLKSNPDEKKLFMHSSINSQKWFIVTKENKKEYVTDESLLKFSETLDGWDKNIYDFGLSFKNLSSNFNYGSKDPIKSMSIADREKLLKYIREYHLKKFSDDFSLSDLIPVLPMIIEEISNKIITYMDKIN